MNSVAFLTYIAFTTWNIGTMWFLMTLGAGVYRGLMITRPNQQKVAELAKVHQRCKVLRDGTWKEVDVSEIVPWNVKKLSCFLWACQISLETSFASFASFCCFSVAFFVWFSTLRWDLADYLIYAYQCLSEKSSNSIDLG